LHNFKLDVKSAGEVTELQTVQLTNKSWESNSKCSTKNPQRIL